VDNVTHTLIGVGIAHAFLRRRPGPEAVPILALASNLPDIDVLVHLTGDPGAIVLRRSFGHSIFLLPVWSLLLALLLSRFYPRVRLRERFGLALLGCCVHVLFDLVNSFGVLLLWPFSDWRPELAIVFIIDLVLAGLLAAPLLLCIPRRMRARLPALSRAAIAGVAVYVLLCGAGRARAVGILAAEARREPLLAPARGAPDFTYVFPEPLGPHRWRGVLRRGSEYELWLIRPLTGAARLRARFLTRDDDPRVRRAKVAPLAIRLERFFKAPVWQIEEGGRPGVRGEADGSEGSDPAGAAVACVHDLRFRPLLADRPGAFEFCFRVHGDGRVAPLTETLVPRTGGRMRDTGAPGFSAGGGGGDAAHGSGAAHTA
jgi:membrane-bound metal-dependent hydrolase YbcI (DUF457 family)